MMTCSCCREIKCCSHMLWLRSEPQPGALIGSYASTTSNLFTKSVLCRGKTCYYCNHITGSDAVPSHHEPLWLLHYRAQWSIQPLNLLPLSHSPLLLSIHWALFEIFKMCGPACLARSCWICIVLGFSYPRRLSGKYQVFRCDFGSFSL